eukprot:Hpha_TRINITY_DN34365_c0_g1::TRINITY_DN34365_c0_g1_i1::g.109516::m.109516
MFRGALRGLVSKHGFARSHLHLVGRRWSSGGSGPPRRSLIRRLGFWMFAVSGWLAFFGTAFYGQQLALYHAVLELAFPRGWSSRRLCLDLLPLEEKMAVCTKFRRLQEGGLRCSIFDWIEDESPDLLIAEGFNLEETHRRFGILNHVLLSAGFRAQSNFAELAQRVGRKNVLTQKQKLAELLDKAPAVLVDDFGSPLYMGRNIYAEDITKL